MADPVRYSETIMIRCQPEITALVDRAARARGSKPSEYVRQALLAGLRADGFDPTPKPSPTAGALYDSLEGRERWAWIDGDEIKSVSYFATNPNEMDDQKALGRTWLPVKHFDSKSFIEALHWREKPVITIAGDHVRCEYPVVLKSLEAV
ncbi:hypothetical protein V1292_005125 [Bradyrhizobium sp. AZCC 1719]|uniref:ribbon-helix-helix domain-containing protein n=1 Tax=Bradyrhizobium sp. AZCC 1719 TaxID=3117028 RepID=UPI002FF0EC31